MTTFTLDVLFVPEVALVVLMLLIEKEDPIFDINIIIRISAINTILNFCTSPNNY